jgi:hypothetical protein
VDEGSLIDRYGRFVVDVDLLPQNGRVVLVVLQDGRQIEGELHSMSERYEIGGETFDAWEIEELEGA